MTLTLTLTICTGCTLRKEPGILHVDLPPDHRCIHLDACIRAATIAKEVKPPANV